MNKVKINGHTVEHYESIEEMPVRRFHRFNKYVLIDSGIGSDLNDVDSTLGNIKRYYRRGDTANADKALDNVRQSLHLIMSGINPRHLSFCPLVYSVDGVQVGESTDENDAALLLKLSGEKLGVFDALLEGLKKKFKTN